MSKETPATRAPFELMQEEAGHLDKVEAAKGSREIEAMIIIAKRFPRDIDKSKERVLRLCRMAGFAEEALYTYPRGETQVTGPSIRLAESIALNWGNMRSGTKEVGRKAESSEIMAYAWDLETNTMSERTFVVPHLRYSKEKGNVALYDPRDIYEAVANQGARRVRSAILALIPADVREELVEACAKTIKQSAVDIPKMLKAFQLLKPPVTKKEIVEYIGHDIDGAGGSLSPEEKVKLQGVFTALKEGGKKEDYFGKEEAEAKKPTEEIPKKDEEKTDSMLRAELLDLLAAAGKGAEWLQEFYQVGSVKLENVPRGFVLDALKEARKQFGSGAADA